MFWQKASSVWPLQEVIGSTDIDEGVGLGWPRAHFTSQNPSSSLALNVPPAYMTVKLKQEAVNDSPLHPERLPVCPQQEDENPVQVAET